MSVFNDTGKGLVKNQEHLCRMGVLIKRVLNQIVIISKISRSRNTLIFIAIRKGLLPLELCGSGCQMNMDSHLVVCFM